MAFPNIVLFQGLETLPRLLALLHPQNKARVQIQFLLATKLPRSLQAVPVIPRGGDAALSATFKRCGSNKGASTHQVAARQTVQKKERRNREGNDEIRRL